MFIVEELMRRSQFTMIVIAAVLLVVGIPRKKNRYRILTALFALLSLGTSLEWYATYIVGWHYFREEAHWTNLLVSSLFVVAAGLFILELVALRLFQRLTKNDQTG
jgi:hypothetical protein